MSLQRVSVDWVGVAGTPWFTSMHFSTAGGSGGAAAAVAAVDAFLDNFQGGIENSVTWLTRPLVEDIDPATGNILGTFSVSQVGGAGTNANDPLPWQTQYCISWLTGVYVSGRQVRGKTYIPGLCEDSNGPLGVPGSSFNTAANTAIAGLLAATPDLQVYSRLHGASYLVSAGQIPARWSVLRSRRD